MLVFIPNIMNWNLPGTGFNEFNLNHLNLFVPNAPFLYPLKTSENRKVFKG